jgi:hypothetical protein
MKQDTKPDSYFTTMFDLYALPDNFRGFEKAQSMNNVSTKVAFLEEQLKNEFTSPCFLPYIQIHEFEALIFTDPPKLTYEYPYSQKEISRLIRSVEAFETPEDINDGPNTAPSKRIIQAIPEYEGRKVSSGPIVTEKIGLANIRKRCPHFYDWLTGLESLHSTTE